MLNNLFGQQDKANDQAFALFSRYLSRYFIEIARPLLALALLVIASNLVNDQTKKLLCIKEVLLLGVGVYLREVKVDELVKESEELIARVLTDLRKVFR